MYLEKSIGEYRSRYLIPQHGSFIQLCSMTIFIKIIFLFNKMIVKISTHIKLIK
jgi:hypothetical protein